jgi:dTDP-4-dehydrorhamnose reductase
MRILLFGKLGQVGWELQRSLGPLGELTALSSASTEFKADLRDPDSLADTVAALRPDVIVNAAAYTAVDRAESEPDKARLVNALAPARLARAAADTGALLIHYSTDYVFDGAGDQPHREADPTGPLNVYGRTKLEGEALIRQSGCRHLILRTSWVYAARGSNFVRTILRLASERDELKVIDDQFGAPAGAELLADVTACVLRSTGPSADVRETYHLTASGVTTWHHYARWVIDLARQLGHPVRFGSDAIVPIPTTDYPLPAQRPLNSRLDTSKIVTDFGLTLPPWQVGVERAVTELLDR